jgi:hypothetical protein
LKKRIFGLAIVAAIVFLVSCKRELSEFIYIDLSEASTLDLSETLFEFDDKHPVSVCLKDSFVFIIQVQADTCIMVLDLRTKQLICQFGIIGHGPTDFISPNFITSLHSPDILLEDGSVKKIMKIDIDNRRQMFTLGKAMEYPDQIFMSGENNFSDHFIVGKKVLGGGKMFYIYNRNTDSIIDIDYFPVIRNLKHDPNYVYSPCVSFNEEKNRIVVGMYFFDMFHLYDLTGKRIKTCCFSEDCIPALESDDLMKDVQNCHAGFIRTFPTNDYCYLLRIIGNRITGKTTHMLLQLNWEGELIHAYKIQDEIEGQFHIDENKGKMYAIRYFVNSDMNDMYEIVSYSLIK